MDRDIEQAADHAGEIWVDVPDDFPGYNPPPAGRGDTTRPDPAVIERAAVLLAARIGIGKHESTCPLQLEGGGTCDCWVVHAARGDVQLVTAVIVPATAEQIAAAIEAMPDQEYTLTELKAEGLADDLGVIYRDARGNAASLARSFVAGLSADATGGRRR